MDIVCADGVVLDATTFLPDGPPRGGVLIVPAMGVAQRYYAPVATWLSTQGCAAMTFDYRGMGRSRRGSLRDVDIDLVGWAERDVAAAIVALKALVPTAPLTWLGHSLGGQLVGLTPNHHVVQRVITVASGSGYWRENATQLKWRVPLLWWGFAPVLVTAFGYFPGARLKMVGDLPAGVMRQWRRWCLHPNYAPGAQPELAARFEAVKTPITSLSLVDDELMSKRNIDALHDLYANAPQQRVRLGPDDADGQCIGHFGFFRAPNHALWQQHLLPNLATTA
jgi:predicted alpha/beta hydrolase